MDTEHFYWNVILYYSLYTTICRTLDMSVLGRDITHIRCGYSRSQLYPLHYQLYSPAYINVPGMKHCLLYSFKKALPYLPPFITGRSIYENNTLSLRQ